MPIGKFETNYRYQKPEPGSEKTPEELAVIAQKDHGIQQTPKLAKDIANMVVTLVEMSGDRHLTDERYPPEKREALLPVIEEAKTASGDSKKAAKVMVYLARLVRDELTPEQKAEIEDMLNKSKITFAGLWDDAKKEAPENSPKAPRIEDAQK